MLFKRMLFVHILLNGLVVLGVNTDTLQKQYFAKAEFYAGLLRYDSAEYFYSKVISSIHQKSDKESYCRAINCHAYSFLWQDKLKEYETFCKDNLRICLELLGKNHPETAQAYMLEGVFGFLADEQSLVTENLLMAAHILKNSIGLWHPKTATVYEWLGVYYESIDDKANSGKYLQLSHKIWCKTKGANHPSLGNIYRYLGLYYKRFGQHDSAQICFERAKSIFDYQAGECNFQSVKCLNNLALLYLDHDNYKKAFEIFTHCLFLITHFQSPNRFASVMTFVNISEFYKTQGDFDQATFYLDKAIQMYFPEMKENSRFLVPESIEKYPYYLLKLILFTKADYLKQYAARNPDESKEAFNSSMKYFDLATLVNEKTRDKMTNFEDQLKFENSQSSNYYAAASLSIECYKNLNDTSFFSKALCYLYNKSASETKWGNESVYAYIHRYPKHLIRERQEMCEQITELKNSILKSSNSTETENLQFRLMDKNIELHNFDHRLWEEYPNPDMNSVQNQPVHIDKIRNMLDKNTTLLLFSEDYAYFEKNFNEMMIIGLTQDSIKIVKMPGENIKGKIWEFCSLISSNQINESFRQDSKFLYDQFIRPFNNILKPNIIVIPSALTSQIPFDILIKTGSGQGEKENFMIENHTIRKEHSLKSFIKKHQQTYKPLRDEILAIVPVFGNQRKAEISRLTMRDTSLIDLVGGFEECKNISGIFKSKLLTGQQATEGNFMNLSAEYPIIHLSTHGVPYRNDDKNIRLAFCPYNDPNNDGYLNIYEILQMNFTTDLIVLSACKTGIGQLNNGEGTINLAWAFNQAGVRSAIISLWDVNDYASSQIMTSFYKNLKTGMTKPEALRQAKLKYIKNCDEVMGSPYYWAGFDYLGDETGFFPSKTEIPTKLLMIILAGMIISSAILIFVKRLYHKQYSIEK